MPRIRHSKDSVVGRRTQPLHRRFRDEVQTRNHKMPFAREFGEGGRPAGEGQFLGQSWLHLQDLLIRPLR